MKRTIIIGDVHGCVDELSELLNILDPTDDDKVLFIGDLINKGPDSPGVMKIYHELGAQAVMGNHEWALLMQARGTWEKRGIYKRMKKAFGHDFKRLLEEIDSWPLYLESDAYLAVHAGLEPGVHPAASHEDILLTIRTWDGHGEDLNNPANPAWFDFYEGKKPVVFGHWAALGLVERHNTIGLDSGCVYGGSLSAVVFPDRKIYAVKAKEVYCPVTA